MSIFLKTTFIIGAALAFVGSFLPWRREGDFISYWTYGIRFSPSIKDNGGFLIILLTLLVIILVFRPPDFIGKPSVWSILLSIALAADAVFRVCELVINRINVDGVVGAPVIQIGLVMVFIGSMFLLFSVILYYSKLFS